MPFRIYRADTQQTVFNGTALDNGGTATCVVNNVPAAGSSAVYTIYVNNGITEYASGTYTVTRSAPSLVAPVISSVTDNNAVAANVSATVNLSSSGSGGTLQYIQTTTNSAPAYNASGWQSGNTFSHPRGTTRYYWAQQVSGTNRAISSSVAKYEGYIAPDTSISAIANQSFTSAISSHTITIAGGGGLDYYQVRNDSTQEVHEERFGNGNITVTDPLDFGESRTYRIYTRRDPVYGGDNGYDDTGTTYTVTVSAPSSNTVNVSVFADAETSTISVLNGGSASSRIAMQPGDVLNITHTAVSNATSVTASGFDTSRWTVGSNLVIARNSSGSRTVKTGPTTGPENITVSATGYSNATIYIEILLSIDTTPDQFTFNSISNAVPSNDYSLGSFTVSGINTNTTCSTGGTAGTKIQVNGGPVTTSPQTVVNGDLVRVWGTAPSGYNSSTSATVTIGGVSHTATIATAVSPPAGTAIPLGITSGTISMDNLRKLFGPATVSGSGVTYGTAVMSNYYRGGTYVPNITSGTPNNANIPTSGQISLSNFYGSMTSLFFIDTPNTQSINLNTLGAGASESIVWRNGIEWDMGYGPDMVNLVEYSITHEVEDYDLYFGSLSELRLRMNATDYDLLSSQATVTNQWGIGYISLNITAAQNTEFIMVGKITLTARHRLYTAYSISTTFNYFVSVYSF
jgi:hypothetical protein